MHGYPEELDRLFPHADYRFLQIIYKIMLIHQKKIRDYGTVNSGNLRAAEAFGIPAHVGVLLRMEDKMSRLRTFVRSGKLVNESFEDSLIDLANYSILCLILFRATLGGSGDCVLDTDQESTRPPSAYTQEKYRAADSRAESSVLPEESRKDDCSIKAVAEGEQGGDADRQPQEQAQAIVNPAEEYLKPILEAHQGYLGSKAYWFEDSLRNAFFAGISHERREQWGK